MIIHNGHVEVYADTSDYEELVDEAFESITTIKGGTKNKKIRHGTRRK